MPRGKIAGPSLVALVALATEFVGAGRLRTQLLTPTNQLARHQALVRNVQELESQVATCAPTPGLVALHGPGVVVTLRNGVPGPAVGGLPGGHLVTLQDVQDVVNLLFAQGAEGVAVNWRRITALSAFSGSEGEVVVDQGAPFSSPITVMAIGDRNRMQSALDDPSALRGIRARQVQFQLHLVFEGSPDVSLPAYDASLQIPDVNPA